MFPHSFKKFYSFLAISIVLGLGAVAIFIPDTSGATGLAVHDVPHVSGGFSWPIFFTGLCIGVLVVGTVAYIAGVETKRL